VQAVNVTNVRGSIIVANKSLRVSQPPPIGAMFAYLRARRPRLTARMFMSSARMKKIISYAAITRNVETFPSYAIAPSPVSRRCRISGYRTEISLGKRTGKETQRAQGQHQEDLSIVFHILNDERNGKRQSLILISRLLRYVQLQVHLGRFNNGKADQPLAYRFPSENARIRASSDREKLGSPRGVVNG